MAKLQLTDWDGQGTITTHRDYMLDLRTQLEDTGMTLTDQAFYLYFAESLPESLDLFITLYEDSTYNVDRLCDKFAKYEMRTKSVLPRPRSRSPLPMAPSLSSVSNRRRGEGPVECYLLWLR